MWSFNDVISDRLGREYFNRFLQSEHSDENFAFYSAIENLKRSDATEMLSRAQDICRKFLTYGAKQEVNISGDVKRRLLYLVNSYSRELRSDLLESLERARGEVLVLLSMGSFPRFLKSPQYAEFVTTSKASEVIRAEVT